MLSKAERDEVRKRLSKWYLEWHDGSGKYLGRNADTTVEKALDGLDTLWEALEKAAAVVRSAKQDSRRYDSPSQFVVLVAKHPIEVLDAAIRDCNLATCLKVLEEEK